MADHNYKDLPLLKMLEHLFDQTRTSVIPIYPYDAKTNRIRLPVSVEAELIKLLRTGKKVEAMKKVLDLTGAGLRLAKDYLDELAATNQLRSTGKQRL